MNSAAGQCFFQRHGALPAMPEPARRLRPFFDDEHPSPAAIDDLSWPFSWHFDSHVLAHLFGAFHDAGARTEVRPVSVMAALSGLAAVPGHAAVHPDPFMHAVAVASVESVNQLHVDRTCLSAEIVVAGDVAADLAGRLH